VSNAAQLVLARFLVFGESARYLAPPFLAAGVLSGGVLGVFAQAFAERSRWIKHTGQRELHRGEGYPGPGRARSVSGGAEGGGAKETLRLYGAFAAAALFLLIPWLPLRAALFVLFWAGAAALGKKTRPVLTLSVILTVTAFNLFPPHGKVLASFGPVTITLGALLGGLRRALTLEGLIMLSRFFIRGKVTLPGPFGRLLGESFAVFERLNERNPAAPSKDRTGKKNLVEKLDDLLCGL
jgi:heptaprenyl diphosphate synthase